MDYTGVRYADAPTVEVVTTIAASPARVWELVSDPLLMPTFSAELQAAEWLDGHDSAAVGARFRGHSRHEAIGEWATTCTVVECDPPHAFAWAVEDAANPTATWRFTLEPDGDGTRLRQWARMGPGRSGLSLAIDRWPDKEQRIVHRRLSEWEQGMIGNLAAIKQLAEGD